MTLIYTTPSCPRCETLKAWLTRHDISYDIQPFDSAAITEMRMNGLFSLEAPAMQVLKSLARRRLTALTIPR